jgi:hypothetical protein
MRKTILAIALVAASTASMGFGAFGDTDNTPASVKSWHEMTAAEQQQELAGRKAFAAIALGATTAAVVASEGGYGGGRGGGHSYYAGNCECPNDLAADGSRCGARSAWSRPGGREPYCPTHRVDPRFF